MKKLYLTPFFFVPGFSSQTLTIHRTAGGGRGPSLIPVYHFHPLTNIETFICNFACVYQTATRWDLPPYRVTTWVIGWWCNACFRLLDKLILGFCYSDLILETGGFELASTNILVLQANQLTKCASHPIIQLFTNAINPKQRTAFWRSICLFREFSFFKTTLFMLEKE